MLTIQRQFSLPNCVLILEGFNVDGTSSSRPLLSTLTHFECHFGSEAKIIKGGRDLLNILAERVHSQAQSLLSGIQTKTTSSTADTSLSLHPVDSGNYQLKIAGSLLQDSADSNSSEDLDLKLNSVQLFDLVEALDQLMEDQQTLPDLSLQLRPLSRKEAKSPEAVTQKFVPFSLGVVSLALVAAVSFVMPIPEVLKPAPPAGENNSESVNDSPVPLEGSPEGDTPVGETESPAPESSETESPASESSEPESSQSDSSETLTAPSDEAPAQ